MRSLKKTTIVTTLILLTLLAVFPSQKAYAGVGDLCCEINNPDFDYVSFNSSTQQCTYKNKSDGSQFNEVFLCSNNQLNPDLDCKTSGTTLICIPKGGDVSDYYKCCKDGARFDGNHCTNGDANFLCTARETCQTYTNAAGKTQECVGTQSHVSGACCAYEVTDVVYDPVSNQCNHLSGLKFSGVTCAADEDCNKIPSQILADGRPAHFCVSRITAAVKCKSDPTKTCVSTAIGEIRTDPSGFISQVIKISIGFGSGIAFLFLLYGSYKIVTSQGNPEGINGAKEIITSAIIGLIFIILAVSLVQIIGFDILGLGALGLGTR
jgi:hypothetical protein